MAQIRMIPKEQRNLIKCEMPMCTRCIFGKVARKLGRGRAPTTPIKQGRSPEECV